MIVQVIHNANGDWSTVFLMRDSQHVFSVRTFYPNESENDSRKFAVDYGQRLASWLGVKMEERTNL